MNDDHIAQPPSRQRLLIVLGTSLLAASAIVLGAVLPAEFHLDPLGIGKVTGLLSLSKPREVAVAPPTSSPSAITHFYPREMRVDTVDIPLAADGDPDRRNELEWKVRMKRGDTLVYSWSVAAPANEFYFDFHGQSAPQPEVQVLSYQEGLGNAANGTVTAPFDGIHGWYLQNQTTHPVVVHLKLSGFYEMRPDPYAPE